MFPEKGEPDPERSRTITRQHGFFRELTTFLVAVASLQRALETERTDAADAFEEDDYLELIGRKEVSNLALGFWPRRLLRSLLFNRWPQEIVLQERELEKMDRVARQFGIDDFHMYVMQITFTEYYERYRPFVEAEHGEGPDDWPKCWQVGRHVRNAFAHGGTVDIRDEEAPSIEWRGLSIGPEKHGEKLIHNYVTPVEAILLMEEMDENVSEGPERSPRT